MYQCLSGSSSETVPHICDVSELSKGCVTKILNVMVHAKWCNNMTCVHPEQPSALSGKKQACTVPKKHNVCV